MKKLLYIVLLTTVALHADWHEGKFDKQGMAWKGQKHSGQYKPGYAERSERTGVEGQRSYTGTQTGLGTESYKTGQGETQTQGQQNMPWSSQTPGTNPSQTQEQSGSTTY